MMMVVGLSLYNILYLLNERTDAKTKIEREGKLMVDIKNKKD